MIKRWGQPLTLCVLAGTSIYYYKKPHQPYIPPPFYWHDIPLTIRRRFEEDEKGSILWNQMSTVVMGGAGTLSKLFLHLNHVKVVGLDSFLRVIHDPHRRQGVITVSNHESVWDDPVLWGVLPLSTLYSRQSMRWALGAADICYTNMWKSCFFALGQTIPTIRGAGIYQPGVDFAIRKMNQHGWVHIYPEAKVNIEPRMIRFKWGVGRISMEADLPPILIPIWHKGMNRVKPLYGNPSFRIGQDVLLVFGDPIVYDDILDNWKKGKISRKEARMLITSRLYDALEHMKSEYEHPE